MRKRLAVITTGGTIGEGLGGAKRYHAAGEVLLEPIRTLLPQLEVIVYDLLDLQSTHITLHHMLQIVQEIERVVRNDGVEGIVVTHGTATLEESAYFADITTRVKIPVVFTGAMRPSVIPGADGPANLFHALLVAASPSAFDIGAVVVMNEEIHLAREVTKHHSMSPSSFQSPEFGPIGRVDEERVLLYRKPVIREHLDISSVSARVELVKCTAGMSDLFVRAAIGGVDGLVIETLGSGQVFPGIMPALREAIESGISIVACSRCPAGRHLYTHYGLPHHRAPGDEREVLDAGVVFSDLSGPKSRIKLAVALSAGLSGEALRDAFSVGWLPQDGPGG